MKPEDLMVGDWVLLFDKTPVKVDCIGNVEVYLTEPRGRHELDWRVTYEHIKPIPLTPEILEKNGFKYIGDDSWQLEEHPYYFWIDFFAHQYGCEYALSFDHDEHRLKLYGIPNVHDIQHALKLCGIDKEIVL